MKGNMGNTDRIIRIMVAAVFATLYFTGAVEGTLAVVLGIAAIVIAITAMINFCPLYTLPGISTRKKMTKKI